MISSESTKWNVSYAEHSLLTSQCHATFPAHQASHLICVSFNPRLFLCHLWSPEMDAVFSFHNALPSVHFWSCKSNVIRGTWGLYSWLWSNHLLQWQIMYLYYIEPVLVWLPPCWFSVTKSCPTLCDPMDYSTPGFPVLHLSPRVCWNSCPLSHAHS